MSWFRRYWWDTICQYLFSDVMIQKVLVGIDRRVSRLGDGIVSHYTMAEIIFSLPVGILIFHFHERTQTSCSLKHQKLNSFKFVQNNNISSFPISQTQCISWQWMISSQFYLYNIDNIIISTLNLDFINSDILFNIKSLKSRLPNLM